MSSNTIPINLDRERMRYLLRQLSLERLEREDASELKTLLLKELEQTTLNPRYRKTLLRLTKILDKYIAGEINLMPEFQVNVSNIR